MIYPFTYLDNRINSLTHSLTQKPNQAENHHPIELNHSSTNLYISIHSSYYHLTHPPFLLSSILHQSYFTQLLPHIFFPLSTFIARKSKHSFTGTIVNKSTTHSLQSTACHCHLETSLIPSLAHPHCEERKERPSHIHIHRLFAFAQSGNHNCLHALQVQAKFEIAPQPYPTP